MFGKSCHKIRLAVSFRLPSSPVWPTHHLVTNDPNLEHVLGSEATMKKLFSLMLCWPWTVVRGAVEDPPTLGEFIQ